MIIREKERDRERRKRRTEILSFPCITISLITEEVVRIYKTEIIQSFLDNRHFRDIGRKKCFFNSSHHYSRHYSLLSD